MSTSARVRETCRGNNFRVVASDACQAAAMLLLLISVAVGTSSPKPSYSWSVTRSGPATRTASILSHCCAQQTDNSTDAAIAIDVTCSILSLCRARGWLNVPYTDGSYRQPPCPTLCCHSPSPPPLRSSTDVLPAVCPSPLDSSQTR